MNYLCLPDFFQKSLRPETSCCKSFLLYLDFRWSHAWCRIEPYNFFALAWHSGGHVSQ